MAKRGVKVVFGLIFLAVLVSVGGLLVMYFAIGRQPTIASNSTLVLRLDDDLHEVSTDGIAQLFEGNQPSGLRAVLDNLRKAKADSRVKAVVVMPSGLKAPFWAKVQEVHDAIGLEALVRLPPTKRRKVNHVAVSQYTPTVVVAAQLFARMQPSGRKRLPPF